MYMYVHIGEKVGYSIYTDGEKKKKAPIYRSINVVTSTASGVFNASHRQLIGKSRDKDKLSNMAPSRMRCAGAF